MAQTRPTPSTTEKGKQRQPPVVHPSSGNSIIINPCQRLNPIVECIRNVPKEFGDILPDYQVGKTTGVLFLSLRYHRLHPEYIHQRIERLGHAYNLRILLLMCDISEHQEPIRELTRVCLLNNITVIVVWSADEAGQYLTAYKQSEHRQPTLIRERIDKTPSALLRTALTSIPRVNKTDVETLRASFGSFAKIARADSAHLARLPGFGPKKVARLKDAFERPFRTGTGTTSALANAVPSASTSAPAPAPAPSASTSTSRPHPAQSPASAWDIELDLNSPSPSPPPAPTHLSEPTTLGAEAEAEGAGAGGGGAGAGPSKRAREESPEWDIERGASLALDDQDEDLDLGSGAPGLGLGLVVDVEGDVDLEEDVDMDMDIAPALRAKRRRA